MGILGSLFDGLQVASPYFTPPTMGTPPMFPAQPGSAAPVIPQQPKSRGLLSMFDNPVSQIGLSILANSPGSGGLRGIGRGVLGYQQQQRSNAEEELKRKYMEAQIAKMNAPAPQDRGRLVPVVGPDGKPVLRWESDAAGQQPYEHPAGDANGPGEIDIARTLNDPNVPEPVKKDLRNLLARKYPGPQAQEPLVAIQTPNGPMLVPRSQATGAAPAASREAPSETELTAKNYYDRMSAAENQLGDYTPSMKDYIAAGSMMEGGGIKGPLANAMISPQGQQYYQAAADWVRAKLRKESGAVISPAEMAQEIKTYFPMPGDGPGVIAQKKKARDQATRGMKDMGGRASSRNSAPSTNNADPLGIR